MEIKENFIRIIKAIIFISSLVNLFLFPLPYKKMDFDKSGAEQLLKETYGPLEDFVKSGIPIEDEGLLKVPEYIKNEKDFIGLFDNKMDESTVENFFEDLVIEKQQHLYIDTTVYIPNIYDENGKVTESYIKKYKSAASFIFTKAPSREEKLIIKESWEISGQWHGRTNYYIKDKNGEWMFDHFNGTAMYGFTQPDHNPWNYN